MNDIDLYTYVYEQGKQILWTPIGNTTTPFIGNFNGNGYKIKNLKINSTENVVGLFGKNTGTIKNLVIDGVDVKGIDTVGAIVGQNDGIISKCNNSFRNI